MIPLSSELPPIEKNYFALTVDIVLQKDIVRMNVVFKIFLLWGRKAKLLFRTEKCFV